MAGRKYAADYRLETHISPEGKPESVPVYQGKYYTFVESPDRIQWLKRSLILGIALELLLLIPIMLDNTRIGRTIYIVLPAVFSLVPIYLLGAAVRRLSTEPPFNRECRDKTDNRIRGGCVSLVIFLAISCIGSLVHFIRNGIAVNELFCVISLFLAFAVSLMLLKYRKMARTKEVAC